MKDLLNEEIKAQFGELPYMGVGTKEYETSVTGITKLIEKAVELEKFEAERNDKIVLQEQEKLKLEQIEKERKDRLDLQERQLEMQEKQAKLQEEQIKQTNRYNKLLLLVTVGTTLLTVGVKVWGTLTSLEFEKEGTVTTTPGRSFLSQLFTNK